MEGLRGAPELLLLVLLSLAGGSLSGSASHTLPVPEGASVTLNCAVRKPVSSHEPVRWSVTPRGGVDHTVLSRFEDGSVVKGADDPQNRFSLLNDSSLLILSVKPGDSGLYSCNRQPVADLQVTTGTGDTGTTARTKTSPGKPAADRGENCGESAAGGSTSHTVHISLVACGLAGLVSAVIATEIRSRRRAASGTRTGETP